MPEVKEQEVKAIVGSQVRVWEDPLTMRKLRKVAKLSKHMRSEVLFFSRVYYIQVWEVVDAGGNAEAEPVLVRIADNVIVTPEMLGQWP